MATYQFSALSDMQRLVFDPTADTIVFDQPSTSLRIEAVGTDVRLVLGAKTVFLDALALESLRSAAFSFPSGSATSAYAVGARVLFAVGDGSSSALFLFNAGDADAVVSAAELTLLATLDGTASTVIGDYLFGG